MSRNKICPQESAWADKSTRQTSSVVDKSANFTVHLKELTQIDDETGKREKENMKGPRTSWLRAFVSSDRDNRYAETSLYSAREEATASLASPQQTLPTISSSKNPKKKKKRANEFNARTHHASKSQSPSGSESLTYRWGCWWRRARRTPRWPVPESPAARPAKQKSRTPIAFRETTTTTATPRYECRRGS